MESSEEPVEPVEIRCSCGRDLTVKRRGNHRTLRCRRCDQRLFVLPIDPYPQPSHAASVASSGRDAVLRRDRSSSQTSKTAESPPGEPVAPSETELSLSSRKRIVTAPRLIFAAAVAAIVGTAFWAYRQSALSDAERRYREHAEAGYAALDRKELTTARDHFEEAVAAADILQRDDTDARRVRQMYRETTAITNLCSESLHKILTEANTMLRMDATTWKPHFKREYAKRWLILDTYVSKVRTESGESRLILEYPLRVERWPVELDGELDAMRQLRVGSSPKRVILAVQLQSCDWQGGNAKCWRVAFNQKSAFLWTGYDNLRAVGFAVADESDTNTPGDIDTANELKAVLSAQSRIAGLEE